MNFLIVTDNYLPEMNANARIFSELAALWAKQDHQVSVITSHPNFPKGKVFPGYRNQWFKRETLQGVDLLRLKTYLHPNQGVFRRTLDFLSFGLISTIAGFFIKKPDIILGVTPQFFAGLSACVIAWTRRLPFVLMLCDLWPDTVAANGLIQKKNPLYRMIKALEIWMYRRSATVVVLSPYFKTYLIGLGIDPCKIKISLSGASAAFYPREKDTALLRQYALTNKVVLGYIGTFGLSHPLEEVLGLMEQLETEPRLYCLLFGDGVKRQILGEKAAMKMNVSVDGPFPAEKIPACWSLVDVALVPLMDNETNKTVLPSKLLEAMAMGVPVVLYAPEGEAQAFLNSSNTGWFVPVGDLDALKTLLLTLVADPSLIKAQQAKVVAFAQQFSREKQAQTLLEHCDYLINYFKQRNSHETI